MTNEEAIKELKEASDSEVRYGDTEHHYNEVMKRVEAYDMAIKALKQKKSYKSDARRWKRRYLDLRQRIFKLEEREPCEDCISRQALRQKLQEHHDFFVNAYGGFSNLPQNDKARIDEISSCIAEVVNAPSVTPQPKVGEWLKNGELCKCSRCGSNVLFSAVKLYKYCYRCGARMEVSE